jgi:hypothetical protein
MSARLNPIFHPAIHLLALVAFCAAAPALAGDCDKAPFATARQTIGAERKQVEPTFSDCTAIAGSPDALAALFAYEQPSSSEDVKTFDVELLIVDARSGSIEARLSRSKVWESDAYKIDSVAISEAAFPLRAGATIFGVVETWSGSSSVSFYNISKLSLYERRGKAIVPLMGEFVSDMYQGEGCDRQITRELRAEPVRGKGYAALRVHEKEISVARDSQSCAPVDLESDRDVIRYKGGMYPVPKRMKPFADN